MIDKLVGHYRIVEKLGEGGMGVVFKARDTRLDRFVALKLLPPDKVADADRQRRFVQEAKSASALNHPNIVHVYDIFDDGGAPFIAMEFVSGKTLGQLTRRRGLPVNDVLKYAVQLADALARAHAAGIVHRDLKPSNIMVTEDGLVKILDFGLAKLVEPGGTDEFAPTIALTDRPHTEAGAIVGTVSYMSPEQAQGKKVDTRSDIFSLGAVLYEALSGRRAFQGETKMSTLTSIARDEPTPLGDIVPGISHDLDRIIARCLRKDPERRFQTAADLKVALQEAKEESESGKFTGPAPPASARRRASRTLIAVSTILLVAVALVMWFLSRRPPKGNGVMVLTRLTSDSGLTTDATISWDGKLVAYASDRSGEDNLDLWLQQVAGGAPIRLTTNPADDREPVFSPDGSRIVFRSERDGGGIYIISTLGGEESLIAKHGKDARFSPDGNWIAYSIGAQGLRTSKIYIVSSTGGAARELHVSIPWAAVPLWSPNGKYILFVGSTDPAGFGASDWWVVSAEGGQAIKTGAVADLERNGLGTSFGKLIPSVWSDGRIIFSARLGDTDNLWQVVINPRTWQVRDPPQRLTTGADSEWGPSLSGDVRLVFATVARNVTLWTLAIDLNRGKVLGKPEQLIRSRATSIRPTLSTDGRRLVFISNRAGTFNAWTRDMATGKESVLNAASPDWPVISPDGSKVVYTSILRGSEKAPLFLLPIGAAVPEKICDDCGRPLEWSPDGKKVLYYWGRPLRHSAIDVVTRERVDVIQHPKYNLHRPHFSPDGKWLAFHVPLEAEQGRTPIFVAPLRNGVALGESAWIQVTDGTGIEAAPWWSPDGKILYFLSQRDGFQCIWGQHLDKETKRPAGAAFDVIHFHGARRKVQEAGFGPGVGVGQLVFALSESTGNIWMAQPSEK